MSKQSLTVVILGIVVTVIGELLVKFFAPFPLPSVMAEEGRIVDNAFHLLLVLAVPVFSFVVSILVYSVLRFRRCGEPAEDGPPISSNLPFKTAWMITTAILTAIVIIQPGISSMLALSSRAAQEADLVVRVEGSRWSWKIIYPQQKAVTQTEMVLPVGKHILFEMTSTDVIHAFWVPAFRMKEDAVPGKVTKVYVTPDKTGTFADDPRLRLQCAEACGVLHYNMMVPVRVVEQKEFDAWLARQTRTN